MNDCLFCKIAKGEVEAKVEWQDDQVMVIHDIHPKAPVHLLVIPKEHVMDSMNDIDDQHDVILHRMFMAARDMAQKFGSDKAGYKLLFNVGAGAGQSVMHLHLHLLGKLSSQDSSLTVATD